MINNTTGCTEEQIREKKRYLNSIRNARDEQKLSVLHYAAKYFHLDLCRLLIEDYEMGNLSLTFFLFAEGFFVKLHLRFYTTCYTYSKIC